MSTRDGRSIPGSRHCFVKLISFNIVVFYFRDISQLGLGARARTRDILIDVRQFIGTAVCLVVVKTFLRQIIA